MKNILKQVVDYTRLHSKKVGWLENWQELEPDKLKCTVSLNKSPVHFEQFCDCLNLR